MPPSCSICTSKHRAAISKALRENVAFRTIAAQYGVSPSALSRHRASCTVTVGKQIAIRHAITDQVEQQDLTDEARELYRRSVTLLDECTARLAQQGVVDGTTVAASVTDADARRDWKAIASMLQQTRGSLELLGKFTGDLATAPTVAIVMAHPAIPAFVEATMRALATVLEARLGNEVAADVMAEVAAAVEQEQRAMGAVGGGKR